MADIRFTKGHAARGDYIILSDPGGNLVWDAAGRAALCDRHTGIGADGIVRAVRSENIPSGAVCLDEDDGAEWFMDGYGPDGEHAAPDGNDLRLFAHYLLTEGLIDLAATDTLTVGTHQGVRDLQQNSRGFQVDLRRWRLTGHCPLVKTPGVEVARPSLGVRLGRDYQVVALSSLQELAAADLRASPQFAPESGAPASAALTDYPTVPVVFVVPADPLNRDGVGHIHIRIQSPHGGEWLSSGSAAAAAALATRHWAGRHAPHQWRVEQPGGPLGVRMWPAEDGEHVSLNGPAELSYTGVISI